MTDPRTHITDEQRQETIALMIYRRMVGDQSSTLDDARLDTRHWTNLWLVSGAVIGAAMDSQYAVAHEHGDDHDKFGCPIFQHRCGHVAELSLTESNAAGRDCDRCHEHPEASAWHLLFRKNKPARQN